LLGERLQYLVRDRPEPSEAIVVAGSSRSGSTWLADLLCSVPGIQQIFEPLRELPRWLPVGAPAYPKTCYLRPEGRYPDWVNPGETVELACQRATRIETRFIRTQRKEILAQKNVLPPVAVDIGNVHRKSRSVLRSRRKRHGFKTRASVQKDGRSKGRRLHSSGLGKTFVEDRREVGLGKNAMAGKSQSQCGHVLAQGDQIPPWPQPATFMLRLQQIERAIVIEISVIQ